jgi:WD40 repeat protein
VRIVDASTWADRATLPGHTLAVTRIAFSPDDNMVLTVSRDRGWRLFARDGDDWAPLATEERAHARMVLDCAWAGGAFVTASRDKSVKVWRRDGEAWACATTHKLAEAATAVAVAPQGDGHLLAVGTEGGNVEVFTLSPEREVKPLAAVPRASAHARAVSRLAWRPDGKTLASAGEDRAVRIFTLSS